MVELTDNMRFNDALELYELPKRDQNLVMVAAMLTMNFPC
jgi:hypothetical protein